MVKAELHGAAAGLGPVPEVQERVCELLRGGMSLWEAVRYIGVAYQNAYEWRNRYPEFAAACAAAQCEARLERAEREQEIRRLIAEGSRRAGSTAAGPPEQDERPAADEPVEPEPPKWSPEQCAKGEHRSKQGQRFTCIGCGITQSRAMPVAPEEYAA